MNKHNHPIFTLRELCLMALLATLGMLAKPLFSPVFNLLTDFIRIPGGSVTAGVSMLFLVFGASWTGKKGTALLMGFLQAVLSLGLGIGSTAGLLVLITYSLPGVAIDLVLCTSLFARLSLKHRMMLAGALGVLTGAAFTNILYFHLSLVPFLLFYIFGILAGALGGYLAHLIRTRLPQNLFNER